MAEKYIFVDSIQEQTPIYEMPEEEFLRIPEANKKVFEVYRFEEMFAMLIDNFYAFNNVILTYADKSRLQAMVSGNYFQKSIDINRAELNLFSSLNMYQDFVCEHFDDKGIKDEFLQNRNIQRCIVMRNYIQHVESFPVIANTSFSKCDVDVTLSSVRFRVAVKKIKIDRLRKGTQKVFRTWFDMNEEIDIYEIINHGMGEILLIQKKVRELPLYKEYSQNKKFLLETEKKISTNGISLRQPCFYFESGDEQNLKTCFISTDTIKFIDENIANYGCIFPIADQFITTAPPDFVKKCVKAILSPAIRQKVREQIQKAPKRG